MKEYLDRITSLLIVVLLLASAVVTTGHLAGYNLKNIAADDTLSVRISVLPPSASELKELGVTDITDIKKGAWWSNDGGVILNSAAFTKEVYGFGGLIPLFISIDKSGVIKNILVSQNDETPSFLERVIEADIPGRWIGKHVEQTKRMEVDAISGATYTSNAIIQSVEQTLHAYMGDAQTLSIISVMGWYKLTAVLLVIVSGLFIAFFKTGNRKFRIVQLILNILVLGFWCGQFISLSLLTNWLGNGVSVVTFLPMVIIVALAFILPLFGKKSYYCVWVCPFGAAQELMGKCGNWKLFRKTPLWLQYSREVILMLLLFMLWLGIGFELLDYEPFSAFMISVASPVVMGIAALFLLLSVFINRPWCRFACPTGQLLFWSQKIKS